MTLRKVGWSVVFVALGIRDAGTLLLGSNPGRAARRASLTTAGKSELERQLHYERDERDQQQHQHTEQQQQPGRHERNKQFPNANFDQLGYVVGQVEKIKKSKKSGSSDTDSKGPSCGTSGSTGSTGGATP